MSVCSFNEAAILAARVESATVNHRDEVACLFVEQREGVYRYLLTLGLYPPQAQEAAQEVFLRLYAALEKGDQIENHQAWIFRVAHNLGLKLRMREKRQPPYDPEMDKHLADPGPGPEADLMDRERLRRLREGIRNLSEQQRRCLFLRMEGLRYSEIAQVLGIRAPTVGEFLRRAIERLRKET